MTRLAELADYPPLQLTPTMSEPVLPFELQEAVIDVIPDADYIVFTATLRSCALTCYAWLRPSRRRLYNRVELNRPRLAQLDS